MRKPASHSAGRITTSPQSQTSSPIRMQISHNLELEVGGTQFVLIPNEEVKYGENPALVVVLRTTPGQTISKASLQKFRKERLEPDDVLQDQFYDHVIFYGSAKDELDVTTDALEELGVWKTKTHDFIACNDGTSGPSPGPYVCFVGQSWQPWKVYHDHNQCLMVSLKPSSDGSERLDTLDVPIGGTSGRVIVPSRCYFEPSKTKPLAGVRITVKDNIDVAGHKTTLCNRAWADLYPPASRNAACVQTLIDAGAIVVGKVKLQAMIMREEPQECIEFSAPFNPRADGYQVPSGSSHASAAGIASYDWLDFSLGSDTNGSGRKPASYNGCFSIRPSTGIMDTSGVVGQFAQFDMPVFFGRDLARFPHFISTWYGDSPMLWTPAQRSVKILYPFDYLPTANPAQTQLIETFVRGLEIALATKRTNISLAGEWKSDLPAGVEHPDIAQYLFYAGGYPYYHDSYHALFPFREGYRAKHGKEAFVQRAMRWQWSIAETISAEERDKYWQRSELYRHWLLENIFKAGDKDTLSIMIFPIEEGQPNYRESDIPPFSILPGFASLNMAPMMRGPEVTAPIGDIPFTSRVTGREEPLPIAVSVLGAPGTDLILPQLVLAGMEAAGLPIQVKTGRSMS